ncbi:uncharacterized protein LOC143559827 [Bidens hawaiensis]|uniref:uncharacterized protein LOC143559827 n=1 Tax=Bidens hawaiensis TaxID=980011 RepID=UPI00404A7A74
MDNQIHKVVELVRARQLQATHLICLLVAFVALLRQSRKRANLPTRDEILQRRNVREEMLHSLLYGGKCRDLIRMSEKAFMTLCGILKRDGGLRPTQRMSVEEQVASFLHVVGNDLRNRFTSWLYRRSASTTSRCLHRVLQAIISLEDRYIQQPKGDIVPTEIQEKKRFYPFLRIASVQLTEHMFVSKYLTGMPLDIAVGTTSDSRIIKNAFTREDKLVIPTGRYCLVDAGLPHTSTLMTPYRGVRYHLKEYSTRAPHNAKELFNLRHASLRNAIERAFGVLKKRFPIIRSTTEPFYSCETQSDIFLACCILHNFLLEEDRDKDLEDEVIQEVLDGPQEEERRNTRDIREGSTEYEQLRNSIATNMWTNYIMYPNDEIDMSK